MGQREVLTVHTFFRPVMSDSVVIIQGDGSAGLLTAQFQKRFNVSSTSGRASLFISPVTVADD